MSNPVIADNRPHPAEMKKGEEQYFCTCGRSRSQPFCDGSHAGTEFAPMPFTAEEDGEAWLCACKHTKKPPYCDGAHKTFKQDQVGKEGPGVDPRQEIPEAQPTDEEPNVAFIHQLAREGLDKLGHHGPMAAMGVPREQLPKWDGIQIMVAQLHRKPLQEDVAVGTDLIIGPEAKTPLRLKIPLFVSDMSFGALSEEAKVALSRGAEMAGTGICSGEGGMLPEEQEANSRYFYELASAKFGYSEELLERVQAFHFKGGQGAKTGAAPLLFRDHISVPTIPALARARAFLDEQGASGRVTLIITGGLRVPSDFVKALALGADGIAIANSAMQAVGCIGARICNSNNCPAGIATQKPELRERLDIDESAQRLSRFLSASTELMQVMARACGHTHTKEFSLEDIATWSKPLAELAGVPFSSVTQG